MEPVYDCKGGKPSQSSDEPRPTPSAPPRSKWQWQRWILRDMDLPKDERSADRRPVKSVQLSAVLHAIHERAVEDGWYFAAREKLLAESKLDSLRQLDRCIEVLRRRGWIEAAVEKLPSGARRCHYRIIWQDLCHLTNLPLWRDVADRDSGDTDGDKNGTNEGQDQLPTRCEPVAQTAEPVAHVAEPVAHAGNPRSAPISAPLRSAPKAPSVETKDGARFFSWSEANLIRQCANRFSGHIEATSATTEDRELLLKIATLKLDRKLSDDQFEQTLEAFEQRSEPPDNPIGYLWEVMRDQCRKSGGPTFDRLLATTDYPRELLTLPAATESRKAPKQQPRVQNREDERTSIILRLRHLGAEAVNAQLAKAGFPPGEFWEAPTIEVEA